VDIAGEATGSGSRSLDTTPVPTTSGQPGGGSQQGGTAQRRRTPPAREKESGASRQVPPAEASIVGSQTGTTEDFETNVRGRVRVMEHFVRTNCANMRKSDFYKGADLLEEVLGKWPNVIVEPEGNELQDCGERVDEAVKGVAKGDYDRYVTTIIRQMAESIEKSKDHQIGVNDMAEIFEESCLLIKQKPSAAAGPSKKPVTKEEKKADAKKRAAEKKEDMNAYGEVMAKAEKCYVLPKMKFPLNPASCVVSCDHY
jgi:hypothetical protein